MDSKFNVFHEDLDFGIRIFRISGSLDAHTAPKLEEAIGEATSQGIYRIIVNFKDLDYISSAGLGVFMAFVEEIRENSGDIKLTEMESKVQSVFELLGFPLIFDILPSDASAIQMFKDNVLRKND